MIFKSLIISIVFSSFIATSVASKLFSFCTLFHTSQNLILDNFVDDESCHKSTKEKKLMQLCNECDCYLKNYLVDTSENVINNIFSDSNLNKTIITQYMVYTNLIDPPPKIFS